MSDSIVEIMEEINFCKFMVNEYHGRRYMPEYRRITEALALAELKLQQRLVEMTAEGSRCG